MALIEQKVKILWQSLGLVRQALQLHNIYGMIPYGEGARVRRLWWVAVLCVPFLFFTRLAA